MDTMQTVTPQPAGAPKVRRQPAAEKLKAERIQELLKALPTWKAAPGNRGIARVREFPEQQVASAYAAFVSELSAAERQPVTVVLRGGRVVVTLRGRRQAPGGGLNSAAVLAFAGKLG
jgi:pterin-4a-carbinolamine dehydratase